MDNLYALILAAGEGKRMHSSLPKVLHPLCGRPMISYILDSAAKLTDRVLVVVGHGASIVKNALGDKWHYVLQEEQLGTGHAVMQALDHLPREGTLLVLCGDTPLLESGYLSELLEEQQKHAATIATVVLPDPEGYGRIMRSHDRTVNAIIEEKDASDEVRTIREINSGTYCFDLKLLRQYLPLLTADNRQQEYYLTDVIAMMHDNGHKVGAFIIDDYRVGLGINNRVQLAEVAAMMRKSINIDHMSAGVTMIDPDSTYIDHDVTIGPDTVIGPNCVIEGNTAIGSGCRIGPGVCLRRSVLGDRVSLECAIIEDTVLESDSRVAPFTITRSGNKLK